MEAAIFSRERPTVGSILSLTFKIYFTKFIPITTIGLIAAAPLVAVFLGAGLIGTQVLFGGAIFAAGLLGMLVTYPAGYSAALYAVFQAAMGRPVDIGQCLGVGFRKLPKSIGVMFLTSLATMLGLLAFVIPGIYAYLTWLVSVPVVTVEETGVTGAIERSSQLMKGFKGTAFGVVFVLAVLNGGMSMVAGVLLAIMGQAQGLSGQSTGLSAAMNLVLSTINLGLGVVAGGLIYFAVRSAKESIGADAIAAVFE